LREIRGFDTRLGCLAVAAPCITVGMEPEIFLITVHRPLPPPTDALPGTCDKAAVLEWRHQNGYALWHPDDATITDLEFPVAAGGALPEFKAWRQPRLARVAAFD
jgi:hypothetical protein